MMLPDIDPDKPVLLAGPTASGKSALAMEIAEKQGGVIVNADASQIYDCWRVVTARPSLQDEARLPHHLYGHVPFDAQYSAGHWLRDVLPLLAGPQRPIIVGGTGLYFSTLTQGLAEIPPTPNAIRVQGDSLSLETLLADLDTITAARIDVQNRARVQRAWEVLQATGKSLATWQAETPAPPLPLSACTAIVMNSPKDWLEARIRQRFDLMLEQGALDEVRAMQDRYDPSLPAFKAIGVPELVGYTTGQLTLDQAREQASIATRRYAKRQRSWFRSKMQAWIQLEPDLQ
ncbi:tRNA dimethylallyltransferase [Phaeobacter sp. CECT 5382]|uniref:tRNA (adenosine(37)-N6)-dimethylallyltransferase MiaA n=1 Tax=Phaeobacter sp. CECT 5382 TaxID=1712645 RepID=UPI0006DB5BFA|nr:tRNA (adenosine(37)-N6)-dimethylallyltransferase MiaA [Phaeobacter sp. CECT 5382]CUH88459.1 tRNA dimethylallyltransferase [Phaeobacter sp. CECT 5382]